MNGHRITRTSARILLVGLLATLGAGTVVGCSSNNAVSSSDYQKLPPGEGARRLQDTLKRRAAARSRSAPLPANVRVDQQPP